MVLYICETCGKWLDLSFAKLFSDAFKSIPGVEQPAGQACPNGCGMMRQIKPTDKLSIVESVYQDSVGTINVEVEGKRYEGVLYALEETEVK